MKIDSLKEYISLYNTENYLFGIVGSRARKRGYLTFDEFYKICMWKSARPKQRYLKNKNIIEKVTKEAFDSNDEVKKISILCEKLDGVGIPTASAILSVVYPEKYAIIDIRCVSFLKEKFDIKISKFISNKTWLEYTTIMRSLARENKITPRKVDMALFAMHRELLENKKHQNLYHKMIV